MQFYMRSIQQNAENSVRALLKDVSKRFEGQDLSAVDYMDDGSPIKLNVQIDAEKGEAVFDFTGTGPEVKSHIIDHCLITNHISAGIWKHKRTRSRDIQRHHLLPPLPD